MKKLISLHINDLWLKIILTCIICFSLIPSIHAKFFSLTQSPQWLMTSSRNASTDIDAVFFNPAGTTKLKEGFHVQISHTSSIGHGSIKNDTKVLNEKYPDMRDSYPTLATFFYWINLYADYRTGPFSFYCSFEPVGGAGFGDFKYGIPMQQINLMLYASDDLNIEEMKSSGGGAFLSPSVGMAYAVNEMISIALKGRYIYGFTEVKMYRRADDNGTDLTMDVEYLAGGTCWGLGAGINVTPINGLNIGINVDWFSKCGLKVHHKKDEPPYPPFEGDIFDTQIPVVLRLGADYRLIPGLDISISFTEMFYKFASIEGDEFAQHKNAFEIGAGILYNINDWTTIGTGCGFITNHYRDIHLKDYDNNSDSIHIHGGLSFRIKNDMMIHVAYTAFVGFKETGDQQVEPLLPSVYKNDPDYIEGRSSYERYFHMFAMGIQMRFL